MHTPLPSQVIVVGGGLVGCALAALLAERGVAVDVFEKRPDPRGVDADGGRSINLVLTNRGLRAMEIMGLREEVLKLTIPALGRMMHDVDGELTYQPYGKDDSECNYSVPRSRLNDFLLDLAVSRGATFHFQHELVDADFEAGRLTVKDASGTARTLDAPVIFGADGAGSAVRAALVEHHGFEEQTDWLDYGYKEVPFPPTASGDFVMDEHALHIWPRGDHMLMGLANLDKSFTGTIYLPMEGPRGFASLQTPEAVRAFFEEHYPDAIPMSPTLEQDFLDNPTGPLGTMRCNPWHLGTRALLIGDAAHAIVPFFGQGLNCGLEDCAVLYELLDEHSDLARIFARFTELRKPNADAIAQMALENFIEMRDKVADEAFLMRKKVERRIEQAMPEVYRSRYATVMYSSVPYRDAFDAGLIQQEILADLTKDLDDPENLDLDRARSIIHDRLTPFYEERGVSLPF